MVIGDHPRSIREEKKLSQDDTEKRTGLLRCYISRVENGHTVPLSNTGADGARGLEVPMYVLLGDEFHKPLSIPAWIAVHAADLRQRLAVSLSNT